MIFTAVEMHRKMMVSSEETLERALRRHKGRDVHRGEGGLVAVVNWSRWVATCECGNGCIATPCWDMTVCFQCGAVHAGTVFPENWQAIETALGKRPNEENRNWFEHESVADLVAENEENGVA